MELKRLTNDADNLIRKVVSRYNQLYVPAGNISQIELDLMLDDLRKLYDTFKYIGQINLTIQHSPIKPEVKVSFDVPTDPMPAESIAAKSGDQNVDPVNNLVTEPTEAEQEPVAKTEIRQEIPSDPEPYQAQAKVAEFIPDLVPKSEPISDPTPEVDLLKEKEIESVPQPSIESEHAHEEQVMATTEISDMGNPVQDTSEIISPVNPDQTPGMLADRFNRGNKSLSETLASPQPQAGMGSRILFQPLADLVTGIGLNDKFSFVSELFGNNVVQYDEAIARINRAVNLDEANWILQKYHSAEWDHKQETHTRLKDFIKRRFI